MMANVRLRPVGTRGGCGAGWGPGACPGGMTSGLGCMRPTGLLPTRTSTRPPHPPYSTPCPYRMQDAPSPIRLAKSIRRLGTQVSRSLPHSIVKNYQDAGAACGPLIPEFGCQSSSVIRKIGSVSLCPVGIAKNKTLHHFIPQILVKIFPLENLWLQRVVQNIVADES